MHDATGPDPQQDAEARAGDPDDRPDLSAIPSFLRSQGDAHRAGHGAEFPEHGPDRSARPEPVRSLARRPDIMDRAGIAAIPMASISPRRLLQLVATVALAWGVISFGRQVATASAATTRADELRAANGALQLEVAAMQRELSLIQEQRYVNQQARAYRLGGVDEIPFALQAGASPLPADAPGSAAVRLGATPSDDGALESWLHVLFGPG